jgi:hypothetical protein
LGNKEIVQALPRFIGQYGMPADFLLNALHGGILARFLAIFSEISACIFGVFREIIKCQSPSWMADKETNSRNRVNRATHYPHQHTVEKS